ncbi:hypothetical protein BaRGS_00037342 [Batillaria attramentaria]|uniref:Uncharacterized protein n=1 Tax=Batillaria attramentaria TaxID=370345 RepID=A0ABD0J975_9CAEN
MAMISPSSALLPAGFFGSDMNTFSPPLMDYLSHTTGAHYHYFPYMACDGTPAYEYSKCYNLPCKLMSEMPGVLYQMGLRQLVLQAEFESLKKFHPTTVAFSETVKEAWGFPSHKAEVATSSSDDTGNGACASSTPSCTPTVETDSEVEEADVDVMQEEGVSNSTPLQEDQEDPAPLLTPASTQIHSQHVSDVVTDPPNQELARFSPPTQDFSVGNGFVRR